MKIPEVQIPILHFDILVLQRISVVHCVIVNVYVWMLLDNRYVSLKLLQLALHPRFLLRLRWRVREEWQSLESFHRFLPSLLHTLFPDVNVRSLPSKLSESCDDCEGLMPRYLHLAASSVPPCRYIDMPILLIPHPH